MKRLALLAIPILAVTFAVGGITANAAENGINHPEDDQFTRYLTFSSLTDYAVEDNLYAFADDGAVKIYNDGNYDEYTLGGVTSVAIKGGVIYCGTEDKAYILNGQSTPHFEACSYDFDEKVNRIYGDYTYNAINSKIYISNLLDPESEQTTYDGEYFNLKQFGDKVYAICDNVLHEFTGTVDKPLTELQYTIDAADVEITIGNSKDKLKSFSDVQFVDIAKDAYLTEVDLEQLRGNHFVALNIVKTDEVTTALLLCESGNAAIVAIKNRAYVVLNTKVQPANIDSATAPPYETAQIIGIKIYASPFVSDGTVSNAKALGLTVKVLNKIESEILESVFYEVEYEEDGETVRGYVAEGLLSSVLIKDDSQPEYRTDPNYSESSDTKTILIVLAVVLLVLAAIVYISHVSAKGKKKSDKKKDDDK